MNKSVYIDVRHVNFWWGVYGFSGKTSWEDIVMYEMDSNKFRKIAWVCACSRTYFESGLEELRIDPNERSYVSKVDDFLSNSDIIYHYYYDKSSDEDFYEVSYAAPRNEHNVKPRSIEMWYPAEGIGIEEAEHCVIEFCKKFLNADISVVKFKNMVSLEDALNSYIEAIKDFNEYHGIVFADELIQKLETEWNVSKDKVLEILNRSV